MNNVDYEIANLEPVDTVASLNSLNVPAEFDADRNVDVLEPTVVPPISVRGPLRRIGVAASRLALGTLQHRERTTARTRRANFLFAWTVTRDNRQLTCSGEPGAPARATGARGAANDSALEAET